MNKALKYIKKNKIALLILFFILLVGLYLRISGVLSNSFAYTYDVGRDMIQVSQIVTEHKLPLIGPTTGLSGLFYGPWWYYILTPGFIASQGSPQGVAIYMVFLGLVTIILAFIFGKKIQGDRTALVFAAIVSLSPITVGLSNQIWNPNIAPLFVLLSLLSLYYIKQKIHITIWHFVFGLLLGLLLDTEVVFGVLYIIAATISYFWIVRRIPSFKNTLFLILGFVIILSPRLFFEVRHNFIMTRTLLAPEGVKESVFSFSSVLVEFPNRAVTLFNHYADTMAYGNHIVALIFLIATIIALFIARKNRNKLLFSYFALSFIVILVFLCGTTFFARAIWGHYLVGLPIFYLLSFACMLEIFWRGQGKILSLALFITACVFMINPAKQIQGFTMQNWEGNVAVYKNQTAIIDYIYKDANGRKFNYTAYTPVVHDYTYQYLFSWYGKKNYGYVPSTDTKDLLYVIIEPDPGYEGRITDWLKIREGDGKVLNEKVINSGINVQTRVR